MPRIRFSIATLMLITSAVAVVICLASRLDNNIREFRRSIESGDPEVVNRLLVDSGHAVRSQAVYVGITQIQPRLLDVLFFKRSYRVKFTTVTIMEGTTTIALFLNESNFSIGPFGTEFKGHAEKLAVTMT